MILSVHLLAGAAIGSRIKNYWAIFICSVALHFLLDLLPHWEYLTEAQTMDSSGLGFSLIVIKALIDLAAGLFLVYWFYHNSPRFAPVLLGAFFAVLPDGLVFGQLLSLFLFQSAPWLLQKFYAFHLLLHFQERPGLFFWGIFLESLFFLATLGLAVRQTGKFPSFLRPLLKK